MRNNNAAVIRKITSRTLSRNKMRNFFVIAAIALTAFLMSSVFGIGASYYDSINMREKRMQGSVSHMAFNAPTNEQLEKLYTLDYIKTIGIGSYVAVTTDVEKLKTLDIAYVSQTQWEEMFCPTFTNIIGHYPRTENEIMLSRYILDAMGIENPEIGMEISLSFTVTGTDKTETGDFILSSVYTEYAHSRLGGFVAIYTSPAFAEKHGRAFGEMLSVNVIFQSDRGVGEYIERLSRDLPFYESQLYTQSPAFGDNYGSPAAYITLLVITALLMLTGYLLIYNVMYISVSKDVRFYGMLKTLGTTPRQLRRLVVGQIMRLCLIGLPLGCVASAAVSFFIVPAVISNSGIDTGAVVSFSPLIYIGAIVFTLLTAMLGAAAPAKKASGISPIDALKFTGVQPDKSTVIVSAKGKPSRMALRNIFRKRKRAAVVIFSLFLGIAVFSSIMTIVESIDVEYRVNEEYNFDFSLGSKNAYPDIFLDAGLAERIKSLEGVVEVGITSHEEAEFVFNEEHDKYAEWLTREYEDYSLTKEAIIERGLGFALKGIDAATFNRINERQSVPFDAEAFERGEIALIRHDLHREGWLESFEDTTAFEMKLGSGEVIQIKYGGYAGLEAPLFGKITVSPLELLVSNNFLLQYADEPKIQYIDINVERAYEERIYNELKEMVNLGDVEILSRLEARKAIREARTVAAVLGGGMAAILGLIGIFNFINIISVGVVTRKREFATLESIGMSKNQMRSMLRNEGLGYAIITLLCSLTLGNLMCLGLFHLFKSIESTVQFSYPLMPVLLVYAVVLVVCIATPGLAYKSAGKMTIAERLAEAD